MQLPPLLPYIIPLFGPRLLLLLVPPIASGSPSREEAPPPDPPLIPLFPLAYPPPPPPPAAIALKTLVFPPLLNAKPPLPTTTEYSIILVTFAAGI